VKEAGFLPAAQCQTMIEIGPPLQVMVQLSVAVAGSQKSSLSAAFINKEASFKPNNNNSK